MKGLLRKDLYMVWKYCRALILIVVVFSICSIGSDSQFIMFYPAVIAGVLPVNIISYDEHSHWNIYSDILPVTRAQIVSSKYIIALMGILGADAIIAITQAVKMLQTGSFMPQEYMSLISLLVALSVMSPSILLPFIFKLGSEKGRIAYYFVIGFICVFAAIFMMKDISLAVPNNISIPLLLFVIIGFIVSWLLSVKLYEKREL